MAEVIVKNINIVGGIISNYEAEDRNKLFFDEKIKTYQLKNILIFLYTLLEILRIELFFTKSR